MKTKAQHIAFRADDEMVVLLERAARREDRSVSYLVRRAVDRELRRLERAERKR